MRAGHAILPDDIVSLVLAFVPLEFLLVCRAVSLNLRTLVGQDPRWLPIVAPPSMAEKAEALVLDRDGPALVQLFAQYRRWLQRWFVRFENEEEEVLRTEYTTSLDGFFALAPWDRLTEENPCTTISECAKNGSSRNQSFLPWLGRMIYVSETPHREGCRRSKRRKPLSAEAKQSRYYQQRERDHDSEFRTFYSVPVGISDAFNSNYECASKDRHPERWNYVVQPLDIVGKGGSPDGRLPNLSSSALAGLELAEQLLKCYLQAELCTVTVAPLDRFACNIAKHVRRDCKKLTAHDGTPVYQLLLSAFRKASDDIRLGQDDAFTTYVVGPHIRPVGRDGKPSKDLAWCFSSPADESNRDPASPWVLSTFMLESNLSHSSNLRARVLAGMVLYCVLGNGVGLDLCCESDPCVLNNCDSVGEGTVVSMLLCPCCLRKLQWTGVLKDVPRCLERLHAVLSKPALKGVSQRDLRTLQEWGIGDKH